jgi:hypothetical protein
MTLPSTVMMHLQGELAHRLVKHLYRRTNKINATRQIARHERRGTRLRRAREAAQPYGHAHHVQFLENGRLPYTAIDQHHHISDSRNHPLDLMSFVHDPPNDPAKKVFPSLSSCLYACMLTGLLQDFIPKLKNHLHGRLLGHDFDGDDELELSDEDRNSVRILNNRIYAAKVLRVNYTTYDIRRDQDSMNPRTHCDVMVISPEKADGAHPFWYARVLGVFHTDVLHVGSQARNRSVQRMEVLWVRWFGVEQDYRSGSDVARLPKIGFVPGDAAFGFLDPSLVLRGCHLVPAFADGRTTILLRTVSMTAARPPGETDDWTNYYVTMYVFSLLCSRTSLLNLTRSWVDRDMFMHYFGGGIGHLRQDFFQEVTCNMDVDSELEEDSACQPHVRDDRDIQLGTPELLAESSDQTERKEAEVDDPLSDSESDSDLDSNANWSDRYSDDELGPEDGENSGDDDNGYASL